MSNDTAPLHVPVRLGALELRNRFIMAPMTRLRVDGAHVPLPFVAEYYRQRRGAGLIVTEGLAASPHGAGYPPMPILRTARQVDAWRRIAANVQAAGGVMAAQLWHVGHPHPEDPDDQRPVFWALSDPVMPDALSSAELAGLPRDFAQAARAARDAGFDGVEIHNGNGMLLDRFLRAALNRRGDGYGGDASARIRMTLEVVDAVLDVWPADKVGIKFEPMARIDTASDEIDAETFAALFVSLEARRLAYLHIVRASPGSLEGGRHDPMPLDWIRARYAGSMVAGGDFSLAEGARAVSAGLADAIVFGRLFLANPDLPERSRRGAHLNAPDPSTFYTPGPQGLVDYPSLAD